MKGLRLALSLWRHFISAATDPVTTAFACLLFGALEAAQIRLQLEGLPPKLIGMLPYVMVLIALVVASIQAQRKAKA